MATPLLGNTYLTWIDSGSHIHTLAVPLQRVRPAARVRKWTRESLNYTNRETWVAGSVHEIAAEIRYDDSPAGLIDLLMAGARDVTVTYHADGRSYDCKIVDVSDPIVLGFDDLQQSQDWHWVEIRLRKTDGTPFDSRLFTSPSDLLYRFLPGSIGDRYTFERTGTAAYVDENGVLRSAAEDEARWSWSGYGSFLDAPALLLEPTRTNELTRSEEFDHGDWTKTRTSISADVVVGGDGTESADKILDSVDNDTHFVSQVVTGATADGNYALSVEAQAVDHDFVGLALIESGVFANRAEALFDLTDGSVDNSGDNGTGSFVRAYTEKLPGGRYRVVLVGSVGNSATSIQARIWLADQSGRTVSTAWAGSGGSGIIAWGAQFEDDAEFATSYIKTTTAPATRNAEKFYVDWPFPPGEMTVYVKFIESGSILSQAGTQIFNFGSDGANDDPFFRVHVGSLGGPYGVQFDNGIVGGGTTAGAAPSIGDVVEITATLLPDGSVQIRQSVNAGAVSGGNFSLGKPIPGAWNQERIYFNEAQTVGARGSVRILDFKVANAVRTLPQMRNL